MDKAAKARGQWSSRIGFLMACAGSAIGLGNIWKFPYIAGENGGGIFVLIYLACIIFIGWPIMVCEFAMGRSTQRSPVEAFRKLSGGKNWFWLFVGGMSVLAGFVILSYYSVVAGWAMHYVVLALQNFNGMTGAQDISALFGKLYTSSSMNLFWHQIFMGLTVAIVLGGVKDGIERASRVLMPILFLIMVVLFLRACFMPGFGKAFSFVFSPDMSKLTPGGALEALGHAFFTLSLGMGAMLTYGSYLPRSNDIVKSAAWVSFLDTFVALMACLIMFPIIFSYGMDPQAGPGLVFKSMPIVFTQMPGGMFFSIIFFLLLVFAALSSAISMLEVVTSFFVDTMGWDREKATLLPGLAILLFGVPSALSGGDGSGIALIGGMNVFDSLDHIASNWFLPLGGLFVALFVGYRMDINIVKEEFKERSTLKALFIPWLLCIRFVAPVAVTLVFLFKIGIITF